MSGRVLSGRSPGLPKVRRGFFGSLRELDSHATRRRGVLVGAACRGQPQSGRFTWNIAG